MKKLIVKYNNRKMYDKEIKSYIGLQELSNYVINNEKFSVIEHKTKKDITKEVLVKVLANQINKSSNESTDSIIALIQTH